MIHRNPVLLPTEKEDWELWTHTRLSRIDDPATLNGQPLHFGLPLDYCRSFPLLLPSKDPKLFRDLVYAQLEKRHLVSPTSNARYDYEAIERTDEGTLVRVDIVNRELPRSWEDKKALSFATSLRYYQFPPERAVLLRERGRLVLVINRSGRLLFGSILNQTGQLDAEVATEIQTAMVSLSARGFLKAPIEGIELWGNFPPGQIEQLRQALSLPLTQREHPQPEGSRRPSNGALLPPSVDIGAKKRRKILYVSLSVAMVLVAYLMVLKSFRDRLTDLQAQISAQEENLGENTSESATYSASQERWEAMANVIDTRRYPLLQLNAISQVMPPDGVVLSNFETKISEAKLQGQANSAKAVFDFLENLNQHPELSATYRWSRKEEPRLDDDGTASFELIGKLK